MVPVCWLCSGIRLGTINRICDEIWSPALVGSRGILAPKPSPQFLFLSISSFLLKLSSSPNFCWRLTPHICVQKNDFQSISHIPIKTNPESDILVGETMSNRNIRAVFWGLNRKNHGQPWKTQVFSRVTALNHNVLSLHQALHRGEDPNSAIAAAKVQARHYLSTYLQIWSNM